ncbi:unnamed protein product, partial [Arabidopsis halleri]
KKPRRKRRLRYTEASLKHRFSLQKRNQNRKCPESFGIAFLKSRIWKRRGSERF